MAIELSQYDRGVRCGERLIGTAGMLSRELQPGDDPDNSDFLAGLDSTAYECSSCGWWVEAGECNEDPETGEDVCDDCKPDEG